MTELRIKRVYDPPAASDGTRVLVDRLWPRGLTKLAAKIDVWAKELSPGASLRKAYHAGEIDSATFEAAYLRELECAASRAAAQELGQRAGPVATLLFASKNVDRNNAHVLGDWLARIWRES